MSEDQEESTNTPSIEDTQLVVQWLKEIETVRECKDQQNFERIGQRIVRKYKNAKNVALTDQSGVVPLGEMFNVLWANVEVLMPALYSRMPKVVAERVFKDQDPVGRFAAEIAERATHYQLLSQQDRFNYAVSAAVQDRLLPGRGQVWLQYKAAFEDMVDSNGKQMLDQAGQPVKKPKPNSEKVEICPVYWMDYLESIARNQYEIRWRCKDIYMTRQELVAEFGEIGKKVKLEVGGDNKKKRNDNEADSKKQALIHVIYDLTSKRVIWISPGYQAAPLKVLDDPYKLKDFWCCPVPLLATTTTDSTYPTADYVIYEALAEEMNYTLKRLSAMVDCVRLVGAMASAYEKDIKNMIKLPDGGLFPIDNWGAFAEKGGLKGNVDWMPFDQCVASIPVLSQRVMEIKAQIDEITSMPDIVRGSSDPNDPVYTQQQKSHWTVIKLVKKQQEVQRFCREIISKMAELIFEPGFFADETIWLMAGIGQLPPDKQELFAPALQLLRDDRLRTFRVDIETDSTIAIDEDQIMARWMQYLEAVQNIFSGLQNISQFRPELMKPMIESALGAVRTLRTGRAVEGSWEKALEEIEATDKQMRENPPPPPPDYEAMKAQNEQAKTQVAQMQAQNEQMAGQMEIQKAQAEFQLKQSEQQFSQFIEQQKLGLENSKIQIDSQKIQMDYELGSQKLQIEASKTMSADEIEKLYSQLEVFKQQFTQQLETSRLEFDKQAKMLEMQEKLMEEKRLDKQDNLEIQRMFLEHTASLKAAELSAKEEKASKKPEPAAQLPVINVHVGGGKKKITKGKDGSYTAESIKDEDD
jgi:hypothetical protein